MAALTPVSATAPFVVGTTVVVGTELPATESEAAEFVAVESSDPSILEVDTSSGTEVVELVARAAGTAEVILRRANGDELGRRAFEFVVHDEVRLISEAAVLAGSTEAEATSAIPRIVVGPSARFGVRFFAATSELRSDSPFLQATRSTEEPIRTVFVGDVVTRGTLSASSSGVASRPLGLVSGLYSRAPELSLQVEVEGVPEADVASITIGTNEVGAEKDECRVLTPIASDAMGRRIDGVSFQYESSNRAIGVGQVLSYPFDPGHEITIEASNRAIKASATIHARIADTTSEDVGGCSTSSASSSLSALVLGLALFALSRRFGSMRRALR